MMTNNALRESIIRRVTTYRNEFHPGKPLGHFLVHVEGPIINDLVREGVFKLIEVTKMSKVDPAKTMTYTYVALNK